MAWKLYENSWHFDGWGHPTRNRLPEGISEFGLISKNSQWHQRDLVKGRWVEISGAIKNGVGILMVLERLLDSVVLIDHFNNISGASTFIAGLNPAKTAISVISYAEMLVGFHSSIIWGYAQEIPKILTPKNILLSKYPMNYNQQRVSLWRYSFMPFWWGWLKNGVRRSGRSGGLSTHNNFSIRTYTLFK